MLVLSAVPVIDRGPAEVNARPARPRRNHPPDAWARSSAKDRAAQCISRLTAPAADEDCAPPSVACRGETNFHRGERFMAGETADVVMFGPKPIIEEALTKAGLQLHKAWAAPDQEAFIASIAPKVRAIAAVAGHGPVDGALMARFPKLEIVSSFGVGYDHIDAKWAGQHGVVVTNTPGRAQRGGRRHRARPVALHGAPAAAGRALSARRQLAEAWRLPAHALAARPHRRHRRHGPHRQGDRAPARRHAGAGGLSLAPADRRRRTGTIRTSSTWRATPTC